MGEQISRIFMEEKGEGLDMDGYSKKGWTATLGLPW